MEQFTFGSALMHFRNTKGPPGFLWKFVLTYIIGFAIIAGIYAAAAAFAVPQLANAGNDPYAMETFFAQNWGAVLLFYLVIIVVGMLLCSVFEAAALRHYTRREGFSIGFGADELRLIGVYFLWLLTFIGIYVGTALPIGIVFGVLGYFAREAAPFLAPLLMFVGIILIYCSLIFFCVRLSPAAAVTIRDRKLSFTSAWSATKGRFWAMFGAFLVLLIVVYVLMTVFFGISVGIGFAASGGFPAGGTGPGLNPMMIIMAVLAPLGLGIIQAIAYFAFIGIPARAAVTDPKWNDLEGTAETFS